MNRIKDWPILNFVIVFILLFMAFSNGLPTTAQANNQPDSQPANASASLPAQAGETPGQSITGSKAIPVKASQLTGPVKNKAKPNYPRLNLPLRPATDKKGDSTLAPDTAAKPQTNSPGTNVVSTFPTASLQFPGLPYDDDDLTFDGNVVPQVIPPDTMGAVGPSQFVMMINGMLRVFNKSDGSRVNAFGDFDPDLDTFFLPVMTPVGVSSFNYTNFPRVRYDRYSSRWILLANDVPGGLADQPNRILLAVSDSPVISQATVWSEFYFQPQPPASSGLDVNQFADYPTLGIDANALYIGANLYSTTTGLLTNTAAYVVRKSSILNGGPIKVTGFYQLLDFGTKTGPLAPQGVDSFDTSVSQGYFIGINGATGTNSNNLQLRLITNSGSLTPTISSNITVTISATAPPLLVPHQDPNSQPDTEKLDPIDDRLLNATIRGGRLYTVHHIGVDSTGSSEGTPDRDGARWYQIKLPELTVEQSGTVYDSTGNKFYWLPSIAVSGQKHAVMGMNVAGPNTLITDAAAGKLSGENNFFDPNVFYTSPSLYNPDLIPDTTARRWGDYSFTSVDPEDDMTFWTIQQFAYNPASYGIQIAKLTAPPPATLSTASNTLQPANSNQTITLNGTSNNGSGFFDPGAGFAKRLNVFIDGEIIVKSITAVTPTSITLNVSTEFTSPGSYTVKVTNPDGQEVSLGGMVTVGNFSCTPQQVINGNNDGTGSLRAALTAAAGGCKFILLQQNEKITITTPLDPLPSGISIFAQRACTNKVEIDGSGIPRNPVARDGLNMNGGYFYGIWIHGFNGPQIVANSGRNQLRCMKLG